MSEAVIHAESAAPREPARATPARARTCVGCGERVALGGREGSGASDLVRLVFGPNGEVIADVRGGAAGRGAHVHARAACLDRAARGGIARSTKGRASSDARSLADAIQRAMDRRIEGLVAAAFRAGQLALTGGGGDVAGARLLLVARDAGEAAERPDVQRAIAEGRAVAWGDAQALERLAGARAPGAAAIAVISSQSFADALRHAVHVADACGAAASEAVAPPKRGGGRGRGAPPVGRKENAGGKRRLSGVGSNLERGA